MKKYLMYLAIAILVVVVVFFAYRKIYGMGGFYTEKKAPVTVETSADQNIEASPKAMFVD